MGVGVMKVQRYEIIRRTGDAWKLVENDAGAWCKSEDVTELEAEIDRLKAPPKVLSAEEVTEPGWYWWRPNKESDWYAARVDDCEDGILRFAGTDGELNGEYIGPLTPPEV